MQKKVYIVIPIYNEGQILKSVLDEVLNTKLGNIIIVDDGSADNGYLVAEKKGVLVLRHLINRGKGAAIKTGIEATKQLDTDIVITMDGDGQHNPTEIKQMIGLIDDGYDVVLGTRLKNPKGMPTHKIIANYCGNFFTWLIYDLWVSDSQSGFRAYSKKAINLIETKTDRYEYDSEVVREIRRNRLKYIEIPIEVRYTEYSRGKKNRQSVKNGIKTLIKMLISN